jgi:hypothetical protein
MVDTTWSTQVDQESAEVESECGRDPLDVRAIGPGESICEPSASDATTAPADFQMREAGPEGAHYVARVDVLSDPDGRGDVLGVVDDSSSERSIVELEGDEDAGRPSRR